jgi:hypothetical protein
MSPEEIAEGYIKVRFGLISDYEATKGLRAISEGKASTPSELAWTLFKPENPTELEVLIENYCGMGFLKAAMYGICAWVVKMILKRIIPYIKSMIE